MASEKKLLPSGVQVALLRDHTAARGALADVRVFYRGGVRRKNRREDRWALYRRCYMSDAPKEKKVQQLPPVHYLHPKGSAARNVAGDTTLRVSKLTRAKLEQVRSQCVPDRGGISHDELLYRLACWMLGEPMER